MQEKEKKTFANMFDKFAMADRKKEALEKQVLYLNCLYLYYIVLYSTFFRHFCMKIVQHESTVISPDEA